MAMGMATYAHSLGKQAYICIVIDFILIESYCCIENTLIKKPLFNQMCFLFYY